MATLVVFEFPTAEGADTMLYTLEGLQNQQLIEIHGCISSLKSGQYRRFRFVGRSGGSHRHGESVAAAVDAA